MLLSLRIAVVLLLLAASGCKNSGKHFVSSTLGNFFNALLGHDDEPMFDRDDGLTDEQAQWWREQQQQNENK